MSDQDKITYFAETDFRNKKIKFGIKAKDRTRHLYVIGKTGMGKSTMLENMIVQDIENGEGVAVIDPHGSMAENLLGYVPESRIKDTIYFAPFDTDHPISFNVMEDVGVDKRHLVANGLMNAFKKIWVDAWSARMEYILNNVLLALLEYPDSTILGVNRILSDKDYRDEVVSKVTDSSVKAFWTDEFAKYGERYMQEAGAAIQNKIGQFVSNPLVRNIIGQPKSSFDVRKIMDEKKILIMNLSKGRMGIENSALLGNMLVTKIYLGAMSRADASPAELQKLPNFYFYVDEFQSFANESFADILSEARKYKLSLTIAHQYINQMPEEVRDAVFGNVGSMVTFRIGPEDAEMFEKEFAPEFTAEDLVNLGFAQIYLRLMIDGIGSKPFSATTLPPISLPDHSCKDEIIAYSRESYATQRAVVEEGINKWYAPVLPLNPKPARERRPRTDAATPSRAESAPESRLLPPRTEQKSFQNDISTHKVPVSIPASQVSSTPPAPLKMQETPIPGPQVAKTPIVFTLPRRAERKEYKRNPPAGGPSVGRPPDDTLRQEPRKDIPRTPIVPQAPRATFQKPAPVSTTAPVTPVSLSALRPKMQQQGPSKNSTALKDALALALKEKMNSAPPPPPEEKIPKVEPMKNVPGDGLKEESKKWEEIKKSNEAPSAPKEVPEAVLKKLLGE